jgi:hypothetical protein
MYLLSQPKYLSVKSREGLPLMGSKRNLFTHNISDQVSLPNLTRLDICKGKVSQTITGFPPQSQSFLGSSAPSNRIGTDINDTQRN